MYGETLCHECRDIIDPSDNYSYNNHQYHEDCAPDGAVPTYAYCCTRCGSMAHRRADCPDQ